MRGSTKIHKPGVSLRPALCMQNSPYHKLAHWLVDILDLIRKDYSEIGSILENMSLTSHKRCFPSTWILFFRTSFVSKQLIICAVLSFYQTFLLSIPVDQLRESIRLCTHNIRFGFEGTAYMQVGDVEIGGPLGPTIADVFLFMTETKLNDDCISKLISCK